jgi:hypothetical protein
MPRGIDTSGHPNRQVGRQRWEVQPVSQTGVSPDRVSYALVGHGPNLPAEHGAQRFGTNAEALGYMAKHGLEHQR